MAAGTIGCEDKEPKVQQGKTVTSATDCLTNFDTVHRKSELRLRTQ